MRTSTAVIMTLVALFSSINVEARSADDRSRSGHVAADVRVGLGSQHRRDRATDRRIDRRHQDRHERRDDRQRRHLNYRIGLRLLSLPAGYEVTRVGSKLYYYADGVFLIRDGSGYRVVAAPAGARLTKLPYGYRSIHVRSQRYYFIGDTYFVYVPAKRIYVVVDRPSGTTLG